MNPNKQYLSLSPLPSIEDVIIKVKLLEDLTPAEELVYLINIEELPEEDALKIVQENIEE
jgi:hypothetical protein